MLLSAAGRIGEAGNDTLGLGPALRERMEFRDGLIANGSFAAYSVPRFRDVPKIDVVLLDRKETEPAGAGETPIMAVPPALANALFDATRERGRARCRCFDQRAA